MKKEKVTDNKKWLDKSVRLLLIIVEYQETPTYTSTSILSLPFYKKLKKNCCKIHLVDNVRTADEQTEAEEKRSRSQNAANQFPVKYLFSLMLTELEM